ncbi:MAG: PQQ-like beta-propeller repeat protein [Sandaracinaceae bacterium]|nr:PQQ-like beta-propeller repeat protein [Sandaracinaceae bacterium]
MSAYRDRPHAPVIVTAFRGVVIGVDARTGRELWRADLGGFGPVRLHVDDRFVVALSKNRMLVIEYETGRVTATLPVSGTTLLVDGELAYVSASGVVTAVDLVAGEILWRNELPGTGYGAAALGTPHKTVQGDVESD